MFIEMNPRIQVEHTVTEEVTDIDLVVSQMRIASGETLEDLGLRQEDIRTRGAALQCRITTEDPANGFRPDAGQITVYRSAGGGGVRLDGGTVFVGAQVSPHFDSMLVKLTCRGSDFGIAVRRARRALAEFRIRGVSTNIPFLEAVLADPVFQRGEATTSFIDERPELLDARMGGDRGTKLLQYLADVTVNQPHGPARTHLKPRTKLPALDPDAPLPPGSRDLLQRLGPAGFARQLRERTDVPVTDTTFRDAHQSLLATRMRTRDLLHVAGHVARTTPQLLSMEAWGGATYDVALRFLHEDPWERLAAAARGDAQHPAADAAAWAQHRRLHPLPDEGHRRLRPRGRPHRARHLPDLRLAQRRRRRCAPPSTPSSRPAPPSPRSRSATPATSWTRASGSTPSTTTSGSPSRSSTPARTCSPSRTWPACCAPPPRGAS